MKPQTKSLVIADIPGWAFDKIYRNLFKYMSCIVDVHYMELHPDPIYDKYDVIYYLCDYNLNWLIERIDRSLINPKKVVIGIRSEVSDIRYNNAEFLRNVCAALAVSNQLLYDRFSAIHNTPPIYYAPGGVDTSIFTFDPLYIKRKPRVGWSGSIAPWGVEFRGINIIKEACANIGYEFVPALRDNGQRNEIEMIEYYHNEIDIYVEMSQSAGRQNGLVEAAACGVPVISTHVGIAPELITDMINGRLITRNVSSLVDALRSIVEFTIYEKYIFNMKSTIDIKWSWESQVPLFISMFDDVKKGSEQ